MKRLVTIVVCMAAAIPGGSAILGAEHPYKAVERERRFLDLRAEYTDLTGKEPTRKNLLMSLTIQNAQGEKGGEVIAALQLLAHDKDETGNAAEAVLACYERNPTNWLVRAICARALVRLDKPKGVELSRKILGDSKEGLDARLSVARDLVAEEVLIGYPVLREGLITPNDYQRRKKALPLLDAFSAYDGAVYGERGEKIDIAALIAEAKKAAKGPKIMDDLVKAELEHARRAPR